MPSRSTRSRTRRVVRLVTIAVASAVVLGAAPTAIAFATTSLHAAPVPTPTRVAVHQARPVVTPTPLVTAARIATAVRGWGATPTSIRAGKALGVHVRVTGGERTVRLERRLHGAWRVVDRHRTTAAGRVTLHWHAPTSAKHAVLRLHVLHTAAFKAFLSTQRTVTVTPVPVASRPAASNPAPSTSAAESLRARLLVLVNRARATSRTCGGTTYPAVAALHRSAALDRAAGAYATRMATEDFFSHESPDGSTMVSRLKAVGIGDTTERENIAAGQTTAAAVMTAWLGSPGHCANLMAGDVTRIGLGHATGSGSTYGQYWVQDFAG
jgi:uncharacterized protein YkwD